MAAVNLWQWPLRKLNQNLGLRPRDWPLLLLMLLHVLLALMLTTSLRSANTGIFLSSFPASVYPWYFLAESVLSFGLSMLYGHLVSRHLTRRAETLGFLLIFAVLLLLGRGALALHLKAVAFVLPMISDAFSAILLIQTWALFVDCLDSRMARRVFPMLGLGGTLGAIAGGGLVSALAPRLGTPNLLWLALALLGGLLLTGRQLVRALLPESSEPAHLQRQAEALNTASRFGERSRQLLLSVVANRLLLQVMLILLCVRVASTIADYQLQVQLKASFSQNAITAYMGTYFAITSFATLVIQLVLEKRIINAYGVVWGMGSTPLTLSLGMLGFVLAPSLISISVAKFLEQITRNSLFKTAVELVYIPFESALRRRLRLLVNGLLSLTTVPLASVLIMLLSDQPFVLLLLGLGFAVAGIVCSILLQRPYTRKLHDSLMRRQLLLNTDGAPPPQISPEALEHYLTQGDASMILFAFDLLRQQTIQLDPDQLSPLIDHDNAYVRAGALRLLARSGQAQHVQRVVDLLTHNERDPYVRTACLEVLRALGDEQQNALVLTLLHDSVPAVRTESLLFLFTRGGIEGILAGAEALNALMQSEDSADLVQAAYIIGEIGVRYFRQDVLTLLHHPERRVRLAAIEAAQHNLPEELAPALLNLLGERSVARAARHALQKLPFASVLPLCQEALREHRHDIPRQLELIRLLGSFSTPEAVNELMGLFGEPDIRLKYQALQALHHVRRHHAVDLSAFQSRIAAQLQREFYYGYSYYMLLALSRKQGGDPARIGLFQAELAYRIGFVEEMIFRLLALLYPPRDMDRAWLNFRSQSPRFRALSLEVLSYTVAHDDFPLILTLLDDMPWENKRALAREHELIDETIGANWWQSAVVREDPWLRRIARWCRHHEEDPAMLEILDRMYLLKQTSLFERFSAQQLHPVALAARELFMPAQSVVFHQDEPGDAFYIIRSGDVLIARNGLRVTLMGEREGFGELEILSAAPRLAEARTLSPCEMLVIGREDFIDLVEEYSDFSRSLLEVLSQRLAANVLKFDRGPGLGKTGRLSGV